MTPAGGGSSNGRTADSDSASLGSNPSPPANILLLSIKELERRSLALPPETVSHRVAAAFADFRQFLRISNGSRRLRATRLRHEAPCLCACAHKLSCAYAAIRSH